MSTRCIRFQLVFRYDSMLKRFVKYKQNFDITLNFFLFFPLNKNNFWRTWNYISKRLYSLIKIV